MATQRLLVQFALFAYVLISATAEQLDTNDAKVKEIADYATSQLDIADVRGLMRLSEVYDAQVHVDSGSKYTLVFEVAETDCDKKKVAHADVYKSCSILPSGVRRNCQAQVLERSRKNKKKLLSLDCGSANG